jgi:competence protein ComEA
MRPPPDRQSPATAAPRLAAPVNAASRRLAALLPHLIAATTLTVAAADELVAIPGCTLVPTGWADGDSFRVRTPEGTEHTVRLYGVDCLEQHVAGETDARRLRSQRRYFGIAETRPDAAASIEFAKRLAAEASAETRRLLAAPFTVHTSFADGRGDGRFSRIYAFVTDARGRDLAEQLVSAGHARAFGVTRATPTGDSGGEYRERLADLELRAATRGAGIWAHTDWDKLPVERRLDRLEELELQRAIDGGPLPAGFVVDLNTASRSELMRLPGVGETLANRIIERRPYRRLVDLLEVNGIGPATFRELKPLLHIEPPAAGPVP